MEKLLVSQVQSENSYEVIFTDRLSVWKDGKVIYRPTVHYAYMPCDSAIASLQELRGRNYEMHPKQRILRENEIIEGKNLFSSLLK